MHHFWDVQSTEKSSPKVAKPSAEVFAGLGMPVQAP
jgi:hypothetical protein